MRTTLILSTVLLGIAATIRAADVEYAEQVTTPHDRSMPATSEPTLAEQWGLTLDEWRRYRTLMQGIRGAVSNPTISPLEVLGIHARSEEERRMFAERWAQLMFEDTARVLAFQREYHAAFRRLYPDIPAIDRRGTNADAMRLNPGDRLLFFTETSCDICQRILKQLLARIGEQADVGLDIYLVDTTVDAAGDTTVRIWAGEQSIPPKWVQTRRVTLNHDNGLLTQFDPDARPPYVVRQRGETQRAVSLKGLGR